ncbi:antichymotrypsin-2-like [Hyposmocoma kahamanoa]|uniref:antichymotrypsin-2-like n=1 Tax=Hyposmocoma kahamanoa TaxID=1477025 RepID=UPI000E6D81FA|nr:antichymotrypsin-2-like [Hyposmocoma kahamanoa]
MTSDEDDFSDNEHFRETRSSSENAHDTTASGLSVSGKLRRQFALSLFLQNPKDNAVCSPVSALMPLGKLVLGAEGATSKELLAAIGVNKISEAKKHFKTLISELRLISGVTLNICSGIYLNKEHKLMSKFEKDAKSTFGTDVEKVDFNDPKRAVKKINAWVYKHTNHKIKNILKPTDVSPSTSVVLVNGIYFSIVAIPYKDNNKVSFVVVLPKSKTPSSLTLLLKELKRAPDMLKNAMNEMKYQSLTLSIPKFKIETKFDLNVQYRNIGLNSMFHEGIKKMVEGRELFVSKAVQSAMIEVNERGTMAAAASAVDVNFLNAVISKKEVTADHPFLFTLVAKNQQLFTGIFTGSRHH